MIAASDSAYLDMAYGLAEKGLGRTSPNPCVGAVVVREDRIVGYGHHEARGQAPRRDRRPGPRRPHGPRGDALRHPRALRPLGPHAALRRRRPRRRAPARRRLGGRSQPARLRPRDRADPGRGLGARRRASSPIATPASTRPTPSSSGARSRSSPSRPPSASTARWPRGRGIPAGFRRRKRATTSISSGASTTRSWSGSGPPSATIRASPSAIPNWPGKRITRVILDPGLRLPPSARILSTPGGGPVLVFAGTGRAGEGGREPWRAAGPKSSGFPGRPAEPRPRPRPGRARPRGRSRAFSSKAAARSPPLSSKPGSPTRSSSPSRPGSSAARRRFRSSAARGRRASPDALGLGRVSVVPSRRGPHRGGILLMFTGIITHSGVFGGYRQGKTELGVAGPGDRRTDRARRQRRRRRRLPDRRPGRGRDRSSSTCPGRRRTGRPSARSGRAPAQPRASPDPGRSARRTSRLGPRRLHGQARPLRPAPPGPPPRLHSAPGLPALSSSPRARSPSTG